MCIEVVENYLYTLLFADDQVVIATDIKYMMEKLLEEYAHWSLKINVKKRNT